ncbi:hypothetical protein E9993_18825 [Labilibacter sediminis]|nr:hypothetical protein E9993_18825 [Labilibacter sediminis]
MMKLVFLTISIVCFVLAIGVISKTISKLRELKKVKRNGILIRGKVIGIKPFVEDTEVSNMIKIQYEYKGRNRCLIKNIGGTRFLWKKGESIKLIIDHDIVLINDFRYSYRYHISMLIGIGLIVLALIMLLKCI